MELTDLRYFASVARTGSFTEGARLSHVSPPAMSKAIKRLETEIGTELFARSTRRVVLTETGEILLAHCEAILDAVDALWRDLEDKGGEVAGVVRIGAIEVFSTWLLPRAITRLGARHPKVLTKSFEMHPELMIQRIVDAELDVGFTVGGSPVPKVECTSIGQSAGVIVCGRGHPLYAAGAIDPAILREHAFVVPEFLGREHLPPIDMFPDDAHPRRIGATIELLQMGIQLAAGGGFLAYLPEISVREQLADGSLRALSGLALGAFELTAITRKGARPKASVRALVDELRTILG
jgi:DNA-binding transcriptional LysR family regulator